MEFNHTLANEYEKGIRRTLPSYDAMLRLIQTFYRSTLQEQADMLIVGAGSGNEILQLPATTFDAASCVLVLHFIQGYEEKLSTLKEIYNHLKPGAPFTLVSKYGQPGTIETELQFDLWRSYWLQHTKLSTSDVAEMENSIRALSFMPEKEILTLLQEAGFIKPSRFFATTLFGGWVCFKKEEH